MGDPLFWIVVLAGGLAASILVPSWFRATWLTFHTWRIRSALTRLYRKDRRRLPSMPEKRVLWFLSMDIYGRERKDSLIMAMAADGLSGCAPVSVADMGEWLATMPGLRENGGETAGDNLGRTALALFGALVGFASLATGELGPGVLAAAIVSMPVALLALIARKARRQVIGWGFLIAFFALIGLT